MFLNIDSVRATRQHITILCDHNEIPHSIKYRQNSVFEITVLGDTTEERKIHFKVSRFVKCHDRYRRIFTGSDRVLLTFIIHKTFKDGILSIRLFCPKFNLAKDSLITHRCSVNQLEDFGYEKTNVYEIDQMMSTSIHVLVVQIRIPLDHMRTKTLKSCAV